MLAPQHARSAAVAGVAVAAAVGVHALGVVSVLDVLLAGAVAAGAGLLPDIDHPSSTVTKALPPLTTLGHHAAVWCHRGVYAVTRRATDPPTRGTRRASSGIVVAGTWRGAHRGLTHGAPTAGFAGACVILASWLSPWIAVTIVIALVLLADRFVFGTVLLVVYGAVTIVEYDARLDAVLTHVASLGWLWGLAVCVGAVTHSVGDAATDGTVRLWAPISWRPVRSPLPFRTGGVFETHVVRWVLIVALVWIVGFVILGPLFDAQRLTALE